MSLPSINIPMKIARKGIVYKTIHWPKENVYVLVYNTHSSGELQENISHEVSTIPVQ